MDFWLLLSLFAGALATYYYCFRGLNYFKKHGILHISPLPGLGNMTSVFLRQMPLADLMEKVYNMNRDAKYVGFYDMMTPILMIRDPELIKSIAVKNFEMFPDHRTFVDEVHDPFFGKNLFSLRGEKWRDMRTILSPAFTSSKMKAMFKLMSDCAINFSDYMSKIPPDESVMEMKNSFTRYTNDVIATCAFGINVDSMRNPNNEFYIYGKDATTFDYKRIIKLYLARSMPLVTRILNIKFIGNKVTQFFKDVVKNTIHTRDTQNIVRPDMLQLMMESRGKRGPGKELTIEEMTAQAFIFFFGGFDSTATLMSFAADAIAVNPNVQKKLRDEIDEVFKKTNGVPTYEVVNGMNYLDAVINEALRLYPVAPFADRICVKDFQLPPALPGDKPFVLKKGMTVWFPVYALHRDLKYFEKPDKFYPERFLDENRKDFNSSAYIPFGTGPRMCIGNRFALLETKVMLFHLLARCELMPCAKTVHPMRLSKTTFSMQPEGGFWLKVLERKNAATNISTNPVNGDVNGHI